MVQKKSKMLLDQAKRQQTITITKSLRNTSDVSDSIQLRAVMLYCRSFLRNSLSVTCSVLYWHCYCTNNSVVVSTLLLRDGT